VKITKVINNNIVVSRDDSQREVVLMGKGLGFQKHVGQTIDPKKIEKTYIMKDHGMTKRFQEMADNIQIERLKV